MTKRICAIGGTEFAPLGLVGMQVFPAADEEEARACLAACKESVVLVAEPFFELCRRERARGTVVLKISQGVRT